MPAPLWVPAKPRALTRGHYHLPWAGVSRQDSRVSHRAMALVSWAHVLRAPRLTAPSWKMALPPGGGRVCVQQWGERVFSMAGHFRPGVCFQETGGKLDQLVRRGHEIGGVGSGFPF